MQRQAEVRVPSRKLQRALLSEKPRRRVLLRQTGASLASGKVKLLPYPIPAISCTMRQSHYNGWEVCYAHEQNKGGQYETSTLGLRPAGPPAR